MAQTIGRRCSTFFYRRACLMLPAFPAVADLQGRAASLGWTASRAATPTATAGRPGWRCVRQGCCWALVHAVPASHAGSPAQQLQRRHSAGTCGATLACLPAPSHVPSPAWHVPCHTACCRHQTPPNTTKHHQTPLALQVGRERVYTPAPDDVGAILKFECTAYDAGAGADFDANARFLIADMLGVCWHPCLAVCWHPCLAVCRLLLLLLLCPLLPATACCLQLHLSHLMRSHLVSMLSSHLPILPPLQPPPIPRWARPSQSSPLACAQVRSTARSAGTAGTAQQRPAQQEQALRGTWLVPCPHLSSSSIKREPHVCQPQALPTRTLTPNTASPLSHLSVRSPCLRSPQPPAPRACADDPRQAISHQGQVHAAVLQPAGGPLRHGERLQSWGAAPGRC